MNQYRVTSYWLNLRSQPLKEDENIIVALPSEHKVIKINNVEGTKWWKVSTVIQEQNIEGYLSNKFLEPIDQLYSIDSAQQVVEVHLSKNNNAISRQRPASTSGAHPLGEANMPIRDLSSEQEKKDSLSKIIDWLDVENIKHKRYSAQRNQTYCNIYAYDYCYLAKCYIPRIWWTSLYISKLEKGINVEISYGNTVREINANELYNWLEDYGIQFGWRRVFNLTDLQDYANQGKVCLICAQRKNLNHSGHICAVVPENNAVNAVRDNKQVKFPLQSQAGATNSKYFSQMNSSNKNWWQRPTKYKAFGFWVHE